MSNTLTNNTTEERKEETQKMNELELKINSKNTEVVKIQNKNKKPVDYPFNKEDKKLQKEDETIVPNKNKIKTDCDKEQQMDDDNIVKPKNKNQKGDLNRIKSAKDKKTIIEDLKGEPELNTAMTSIELLQNTNNQLNEEIKIKVNKIKELEAKIKRRDNTINKLKKDNEDTIIRRDAEEFNNIRINLESELGDAKSKLEESNKELDQLKSQYCSLCNKIFELQDNNMYKENIKLKGIIQELEAQLAQERKINQSYKYQINDKESLEKDNNTGKKEYELEQLTQKFENFHLEFEKQKSMFEEFKNTVFQKFFESQQSNDVLKQICEEVKRTREEIDQLNQENKEKSLFDHLDQENQMNIIKYLNLKRSDSGEQAINNIPS